MSKFNFIDLFCGCGGFTQGFYQAGYNPLLGVDMWNDATTTYKYNFPMSEIINDDITNISTSELLASAKITASQVDGIIGGPPCQGFSVQRIGGDLDERNHLVEEYINKVIAIRPKMFILENVPGIEGKRGTDILSRALAKVEESGYFIHEKILDAQDYGVPQRRRRVVIIGERKDHESPLFEYPEPQEYKITVREMIAHLPEPPGDGSEHPNFSLHRRDRLSAKNIARLQALKPGQGRDFLPFELLADCHKVSSNVIGHRNVYGRMPWDDVSPTITARFDSFTRGMFGHPEQNRSISLREGAMLQTFPVDFVFVGNKVEVARQIGNAVPVAMAMAVGLQIIKCLDKWNN